MFKGFSSKFIEKMQILEDYFKVKKNITLPNLNKIYLKKSNVFDKDKIDLWIFF